MVNALLNKYLIQAIQVTSLECSKTCYSSNIILEENNLPLIIMYCLFSKTDVNAKCWPYVAFKCGLAAAITLSLCAGELPPTSDKKDAE